MPALRALNSPAMRKVVSSRAPALVLSRSVLLRQYRVFPAIMQNDIPAYQRQECITFPEFFNNNPDSAKKAILKGGRRSFPANKQSSHGYEGLSAELVQLFEKVLEKPDPNALSVNKLLVMALSSSCHLRHKGMIQNLVELHGPEIWDIVPMSQQPLTKEEASMRKENGSFIESEDVQSAPIDVHERFCHLLGMNANIYHPGITKSHPVIASLLHLACHLKTDFFDGIHFQLQNVEYHAPMQPSALYRRQLYKISHDGENGDSGEYLSLMEDAQGNPLSSVTLKCAGSPMASYVPDSMALAVFY